MEKRHGFLFGFLFLTAALLWALSLWGRTEILRLDRSILQQENALRLLKDEEKRLESLYYRPIDLEEREKAALALGMDKPRREQLVRAQSVLPDAVTVQEMQKHRDRLPFF